MSELTKNEGQVTEPQTPSGGFPKGPPLAEPPVAVSEDRIREELKQVVDPELFINIIDLGLVYVIDLKEREDQKKDINIEMTLTSPACPAGPQLIQQTHQALGRLEGVGEVNVKLVMDPPWTPDRMTEEARDQLGIF